MVRGVIVLLLLVLVPSVGVGWLCSALDSMARCGTMLRPRGRGVSSLGGAARSSLAYARCCTGSIELVRRHIHLLLGLRHGREELHHSQQQLARAVLLA